MAFGDDGEGHIQIFENHRNFRMGRESLLQSHEYSCIELTKHIGHTSPHSMCYTQTDKLNVPTYSEV
jgi:hypothetical protein